ncbi:hypothetical protein ACFWGN_11925 [Oerskovia sp. NPDC060338]|uniref:hypothetical protein n=1 Tax=Oerskovia sp. NPDC060338 TaxID=3347100 RepID=UPI00365C262D
MRTQTFDDQAHPRAGDGRFTAKDVAEADGGLDALTADAPPVLADRAGVRRVSWRTVREDHSEDGRAHTTVERAKGTDTAFEQRVRLLLDVSPTTRVVVERETSEVNLYGCDTWESDEEITVRAGGRERKFDSTADLFRRLEEVQGPARQGGYTGAELKDSFLQAPARFIFRDGRSWSGRLGNASGNQILLIGDTPAPGSWSAHRSADGEMWSYGYPGQIDEVFLDAPKSDAPVNEQA